MSENLVPRSPHRFDPSYFRSVGGQWASRLVALLVGIALGAAALGVLYARRVVPDELGVEGWAVVETFRGRRLNAWHLEEYAEVYPSTTAADVEGLWLGNSQLHAVNQLSQGDHTAPHYASERLGWPMYALSLPNASLQEHLVVLKWALLRRHPRILVLPIVYDDLREDGLRPEFRSIASPELLAALGSSPLGKQLAGELHALRAEQTDFQGPTRGDGGELAAGQTSALGFLHAAVFGDISLQKVCEDVLERRLSAAWNLWAKRSEMYATVLIQATYFRNWVFGITATSKRPMIPVRYDENMAALREILETASRAGIRTLVYVVPLRQDIEPPYFPDQYREWKGRVAELTASIGGAPVRYVDIDTLVPARLWGLSSDQSLDFMHFRGEGHRLLGERIAELAAEMLEENTAAPDSRG